MKVESCVKAQLAEQSVCWQFNLLLTMQRFVEIDYERDHLEEDDGVPAVCIIYMANEKSQKGCHI